MLLDEALLHRVEHAVLLEALDGADLVAVGHGRQHGAATSPADRPASTTQVPQFDVSQPQWVPVSPSVVAQEVDEQQPRLDVARRTSSPLTVMVTCIVRPPVPWARAIGAAQRPRG